MIGGLLLALTAGCAQDSAGAFGTPPTASEGGITYPEQELGDAAAVALLVAQLQVAGSVAPWLLLEAYRAGDEGDCLAPLDGDLSGEHRSDCVMTGPDTELNLRGYWSLSMTDGCDGGAQQTLSLDAAATLEGTLTGQSVDTTLDLEYAYALEGSSGWWEWSGSLAPSDLPDTLPEAQRSLVEGRLFQGDAVRWSTDAGGTTISGTFADSGAGTSAVSTPTPLQWQGDCAWPSSGELLIQATTDAVITFNPDCTEPSWSLDDRAQGPIDLSFYPPTPLCP